jgi:ribosome recycling factor
MLKDKAIPEDEVHRRKDEIQKITDEFVKKADEAQAKKESEILSV